MTEEQARTIDKAAREAVWWMLRQSDYEDEYLVNFMRDFGIEVTASNVEATKSRFKEILAHLMDTLSSLGYLIDTLPSSSSST